MKPLRSIGTVSVFLIGLLLIASCLSSDPSEQGRDALQPITQGVAELWRSGRVSQTPAVWEKRGEWVGADTCEACHPDQMERFQESSHAVLLVDEDGFGCESCHGPGGNHGEEDDPGGTIDDLHNASLRELATRCVRCHFDDLRALDGSAVHSAVETTACRSCHPIHSEPKAPEVDAGKPETAGEDSRCESCHPGVIEAHLKSRHAALLTGPAAEGCAACHSGIEEHLAGSSKKGAISVPTRAVQSESCLSCHRSHEALGKWKSSAHQQHGVGCMDCHDLLGDHGAPSREEQGERVLCGRCHSVEVAEFQLPNHHPLENGALKCSDCHDPHGGRQRILGRRLMDQRCTACHQRQGGPFLFEHDADRLEGCGACHAPHGSANRRLLKAWPVKTLCLQCHVDTPANHNLASFSPFRNCLDCHTEVHGSDAHAKLFR